GILRSFSATPRSRTRFVSAAGGSMLRAGRFSASIQIAAQAGRRTCERAIKRCCRTAEAALEERKARLAESTRDQAEEPPILHPGLAEVYRRKVEKLTHALNKEGLRAEAAETLRSMIHTKARRG